MEIFKQKPVIDCRREVIDIVKGEPDDPTLNFICYSVWKDCTYNEWNISYREQRSIGIGFDFYNTKAQKYIKIRIFHYLIMFVKVTTTRPWAL